MEHYQFGMIITIRLDVDTPGQEEGEAWADETGQQIIDALPELAGVEYKIQKIIHPQHLLELENAVEAL